MDSRTIRETFLRFFEDRGHTRHPSAPLLPEGDPTLLFTGAGMNQFKDMFLGSSRLPFRRATTVQKCLRVPDLEEVGRTPIHHTFFEMLGNFSFGDYFKKEAIPWAWELVTKGYGIDPETLWVTIYEDDDEAFSIWTRGVGIAAARVVRCGEKDNFWPANAPSEGPDGPCGPCSEIYVDRGAARGCGRPTCGPACDCRRFFEIWNLVFMQFERQGVQHLEPLARKNIDTGAGLERLACVLQDVETNFDTDLFRPIVTALAEACGVTYGTDRTTNTRLRRMADHLRACVFCISDGILPSNERQGYVLRKIFRRAMRDARRLDVDRPILAQAASVVTDLMGPIYPELPARCRGIQDILAEEEDRFRHACRVGEQMLSRKLEELRGAGDRVLDGREAFVLYDTYGYPVDLTEATLSEQGFRLDREGFEREMQRQRKRAREGSAIAGAVFEIGIAGEIERALREGIGWKEGLDRASLPPSSRFVGYDSIQGQGRVLAVLREGKAAERLLEGEEGGIVTDATPFYPEGGGQIGDRGLLATATGRFEVRDTIRSGPFIVHHGRVAAGELRPGDRTEQEVDEAARRASARNHTATHLLHQTLRDLLGTHVTQAGSLVDPDHLRFDFNHRGSLDEAARLEIEERVNARVLLDLPVASRVVPFQEAIASGAMALFGEKYGNTVRVVTIDDWSRELCGGTHVGTCGQIGYFKILSEGSIAAGKRRIEAVTGIEAVRRGFEDQRLLLRLARLLRVRPADLHDRVGALLEEARKARKAMPGARGPAGQEDLLVALRPRFTVQGDVQILVSEVPEGLAIADLRHVCDHLRPKEGSWAIVLASRAGSRAQIVVSLSEDLPGRGLDAGVVAREAGGALGGGGGGRGHRAQAQGPKVDALPEALEQVRETLAAAIV